MGIVIDGQIYTGSHDLAGKVGWTVLLSDDQPRTMTDLVSAKGIIGRALQLLRASRKTSSRRLLLEKGDDLSLPDLDRGYGCAGDRLIHDLAGARRQEPGADCGQPGEPVRTGTDHFGRGSAVVLLTGS